MRWQREWFLRVPWGKLALASRGHPDGEPVLLVHGRQDSLSIFDPLVRQMSEQYYYVAIDMPGNGLSDAFPHVTNEPLPYGEPSYAMVFEKPPRPARPFISFNKYCQNLVYTNKTRRGPKLMRFHFLYAMELALIHLGWDQFIFIGHSMGCEQGLFYNVLYPGQISKMVLLDAGPTLMRMQIEDNAEYQSLFFDPYYENYKKENFGKKTRYKYTVTESMQRLRDLSRAQCNHLLTRNFHEIAWHPIQGWHPNEIRIVARKTFLVSFDVDQNENVKLLPNGTRTMVLWNLKENDLIKLDDHVVLKQDPDAPLNIHAYGEKVRLIIHLTKNACVETMTEFPIDTVDSITQDEESDDDDDRSFVEGDSNNNHDIPTGVPKDLAPAQQVFFLRTNSPCGTNTVDEAPDQGRTNVVKSSVGKNVTKNDNKGGLNEDLAVIEEESNEMQSSGEGRSNYEQHSNEKHTAHGRSKEELDVNEGNLNEEQSSNKKRYYFCDVCIVFSRVLGHREIRKAHRLEDLEKHLLKIINSSSTEDIVSIGCESLSPISDDDPSSNETDSNRGTSFDSEFSTTPEVDEASSPNEARSNLPLGLNEAQCSHMTRNIMGPAIQELVKRNIRDKELSDTDSEDLPLTATANYMTQNPETSKASQTQSSNEAHGSNAPRNINEAQNDKDSPKLPQNGNESRDGEEPKVGEPNAPVEPGNINRPVDGNEAQNAESRDLEALCGLIQRMQENDRVVGYLSWDNRLKNLAPQNYGNDYYFELFKSIPPTLLVAASDGAKNVPPIPRWRQGAKELLDKMATLDNFHRVDVEGSHDVHYTHPERVLPFINAFLKDNKVSSKL